MSSSATPTEITRDIVVAMIGASSSPVTANSVQNVVDAFEKIYAVVEEKWRVE